MQTQQTVVKTLRQYLFVVVLSLMTQCFAFLFYDLVYSDCIFH